MPEYKNPIPTADAIIDDGDGRIVLVLRKNIPYGWAIPGGFVDYGEEVGHACAREAKEETGLDVDLVEQLFTYSDPKRDPRKHTISTVFIGWAEGTPRGGDDAAEAKAFALDELPRELAFDHGMIVDDYVNYKRTGKRRKI